METKHIVGLILVAIIVILPLAMYSGLGEDEGYFGGSDDVGSTYIEENYPDYELWTGPIWEPPSGEIESLLFGIEAAIGGIIFGYVFGRWHGSKD